MATDPTRIVRGPSLAVLEGGRARKPDRRTAADEARIEAIAFMDETVRGADEAHAIVLGLASDHDDGHRPTDLRWRVALHLIGRMGARAIAAKAELIALGDGPDAA